ncbi:hypothetical protein ACFXHA_01705 [Nocardia sp. NPDC059240]|uniref:hypothetical protein n=1 Tax=Nocardia sp. NPDC059240 TaxID=3346786 RepID=UPI0036A8764F
MAGTLVYRLRVEHIYQRRFDSADLAVALRFSHWYIITRRPITKIVAESVRIDDQILTADFSTHTLDGVARVGTSGSDFEQLGGVRDFRVYADGAYFSMYVGDQLVHGDAWALASLLSGAESDIAGQEVMYIGQAFGDDGSSNAWHRTQNHKKLQRIYEDHVDSGYEIFVAPLAFEDGQWTSDDHIDDSEQGPSLEEYLKTFRTSAGNPITSTAVDLIEHSLISYFVPPYNEKLTEWRAGDPTLAMQAMRSAGFRLLQVILDGWGGLARFHSAQSSALLRSHVISQDIPPEPRLPVLRGISAPTLSDWRLDAIRVREGQAMFTALTEHSDVILRVFGVEAPRLRRPPAVHLATEPTEGSQPEWRSSNADSHRRIREHISSERQKERRARDAWVYNGVQTYDPATGAITVGETLGEDPVPWKWRLNDPVTGAVCSTLVIGNQGMGKSSFLRLVMTQALQSRRFFVLPSDPSGRNGFDVTWPSLYDDGYVATDLEATLNNLAMAERLIESRRAAGNYKMPSDAEPAIFVAIDDADILLRDKQGAEAVTGILSAGAHAGVGLLLVVTDIAGLESCPWLLESLIQNTELCAMMPDGRWVMADLRARYARSRTTTVVNSVAVLRGSTHSVVGIVIATADPATTFDAAKRWANEELGGRGITLGNWKPPDGLSVAWHAYVPGSMDCWELRLHTDAWALIRIFSSFPHMTGPQVLDWASGVVAFHLGYEPTGWQVGPSAVDCDGLTYYAEVVEGGVPINQIR